ncbi:hypothetical protein H4R33_002826 [Dimargaris cristalligena]|uniref:Chitin-binding type-4 domain-containing protein n=1 Tax=Dimargaris cristalligena TaxID=215637 RepID=A0A4P9ZZ78_9FUNG|nr:hypothetical protein H4R33_002826 [Dimargaris cristalligena]RKP39074.1 hypothetical protein BJ085DRAFT_29969 [Dimargaris cristalligena]|eukprot:RKP39074.1 hypothetical protein BJ085DRAFT_29969 [Dimargaris cristalligena]
MLLDKQVPLALVGVLTLLSVTLGHSWTDCTKYNTDTKKCEGHMRLYNGRGTAPADDWYTHKLEARPANALLCDPKRQASLKYYAKFKIGSSYPGGTNHVLYRVNGHQAFANTKVKVVYFATDDIGKLKYADLKKGQTVGEFTFMDKTRCDGNKDDSNCWGSYTVPENAPAGPKSFVWIWAFDQNPAGEEYSSCFDLIINPIVKAKL